MNKYFIRDASGQYVPQCTSYSRDQLIQVAHQLVSHTFRKGTRVFLQSPDSVKDYIRLHLAEKEAEVFWAVFLNNRHCVIGHEILFNGTIDAATVHPRVVVQKTLACNAAAVIFAHNHPSGVAEHSRADIEITAKLKKALALIDVRVLDHLIVGDGYTVSLAERGEI